MQNKFLATKYTDFREQVKNPREFVKSAAKILNLPVKNGRGKKGIVNGNLSIAKRV